MKLNKFIYITGCDGTGKTTQAHLLIDRLRSQGIKTKHVWLRFPFLFSIPLLSYAHWRGCSWYEETDGFRHGYWDFRQSWLLRTCLPWTLLFDAALASIFHIHLPLLLGKVVVCERYVIDMLVDLSLASGDPHLHRRLPGQFFYRLLPRHASIFLLELDAATIRQRRRDLRADWRLHDRLHAYSILSDDLSLTTLDGIKSVAEINDLILKGSSV